MDRRGEDGRGDFFGDQFGGFGGGRGLASSFFGGRDPFDDPFFNRPFGSTFGSSPFDHNMFGSSPFGHSMFGSRPFGHSMFGNERPLFGDSTMPMFIGNETQPEMDMRNSREPVIQELSSDDEGEANGKNENENANNKPLVEEPDDEIMEGSKPTQYRNEYTAGGRVKPPLQNFKFHSSSVTYGGINGAYYTSSTTRRMGDDGVTVEESKQADTTTGEATHRISRGIHDKNAEVKCMSFDAFTFIFYGLGFITARGHSFTRKLNSDGKVNTLQTLHNLNEDELENFEESWKGKAKRHLPEWDEGVNMIGGSNVNDHHGQASRGWDLPQTRSNGETRTERKNPSIRRIQID